MRRDPDVAGPGHDSRPAASLIKTTSMPSTATKVYASSVAAMR